MRNCARSSLSKYTVQLLTIVLARCIVICAHCCCDECIRTFSHVRLLVAPRFDPDHTENEVLLGSGAQTISEVPTSDGNRPQLDTPKFFPARSVNVDALARTEPLGLATGAFDAKLNGVWGNKSDCGSSNTSSVVASGGDSLMTSAPFALVGATPKSDARLATEEHTTPIADQRNVASQNLVQDVWEIEWQKVTQ